MFIHTKTEEFFIEKYRMKNPMPEMHYHHSYEMYYILEGEREYFVEDQFFMLYKGDLIFIPKGMIHRTAGKGATRVLIYFKDEFAEKFFKQAMLEEVMPTAPTVFHLSENERPAFEEIMNSMLMRYTNSDEGARDKNRALIAAELLQMLAKLKCDTNTYISPSFSNKHIAAAVKYINENYTQITTIDSIANELYISKHRLCHLFKECLGMSLMTYINILKIRNACELIKKGDDSMMEIAIKSGFNSASYFSKAFKAQKGMSPSEYAKTVNAK